MKVWRLCLMLAAAVMLLTASSPLVTHGKLQAPMTTLSSAAGDLTPPPPVLPRATYGPFVPEESAQPGQPVQVEASLPVRLEVPRLNFRVRVEGNRFGNVIDPPFDPATVAKTIYFDTTPGRGTLPGSNTSNSSYFAGHTCRKDGCLTAFNVLDQHLQQGDDIYLTTKASKAHGLRLHYVVTFDHLYAKNALISAAKVWEIVPNRLVFITCNLREDGSEQTDNRVFFAQYVGLE